MANWAMDDGGRGALAYRRAWPDGTAAEVWALRGRWYVAARARGRWAYPRETYATQAAAQRAASALVMRLAAEGQQR